MHDQTVSSVGISLEHDLNMDLVQKWIGNLLQTRGVDIFRMKGVLAIAARSASSSSRRVRAAGGRGVVARAPRAARVAGMTRRPSLALARARRAVRRACTLFDGEPSEAWKPGEKRASKLIFIGKKLDREELTSGLDACIDKSAAAASAAAARGPARAAARAPRRARAFPPPPFPRPAPARLPAEGRRGDNVV